MIKEIPAYQWIDIALGADKSDIATPVRGWYIEIPDQEGRDIVRKINQEYQFAYTEVETHEKELFAKTVSKYPNAVYATKCWIHQEIGRKCRTPR